MGLIIKLSFPLYCLLLPTLPLAAGFSTYDSQHDKLAEHKIVTVGNLSLKSRVSRSKDSTYDKQRKLFELNGLCFYANYFLDYSPAMLLLDKYEQSRVAVFNTSYSEIKVSIEDVQVVKCSEIDKDDAQKTLDDIKDMQKWMDGQKRRTEDLQREIKELERMEMERKSRAKK